ncbi:MAG TPA: chemotaxis protein CheB [Polyangiales bacterium]|nr:chemotaxis protein CheB [Polyangiales bacterium]
MDELAHCRDIVVVGASAGGPEAIAAVIAQLPASFPASIFVVQHMSPTHVSRLPELLTRRGALPAEYPDHGQGIERGKIYVAPADTHLQLRPGAITVTRGAKENSHRPSIDALFRSAARSYGPRVIGVVLSGYLDGGSAGLLSVKARGGVTIVQDPSEAQVPDMPRNALERARPDHVVTLAQLPTLLCELVVQPAPDSVGLTFSLESVLDEHSEETERALWSGVRALQESASLVARAAAHSTGELRERLYERRGVLLQDARLVREILIGR